jgi:predicted nucleic acid-binding protein
MMELAVTDLYRARWTEHIQAEWLRNVLEKAPQFETQLKRTQQMMNANVRESLVIGYEDLIEGLHLPDPDDRHVLAAAIRCQAQVIVTFNLKDFPLDYLARFGVEAQHPDVFLLHVLDLNERVFLRCVEDIIERLRKPPMTRDQYLDSLVRQSLPNTVTKLRGLL